MRIRSTGLTLFVGLSMVVAACSSSTSSTAPSAAAPSTAASAAASAGTASASPSEAASVKPQSDLKIGVVTDVGAVNDKNFNQFSYAGAVNGAVSIGAKTPSVVVPKATFPTNGREDMRPIMVSKDRVVPTLSSCPATIGRNRVSSLGPALARR